MAILMSRMLGASDLVAIMSTISFEKAHSNQQAQQTLTSSTQANKLASESLEATDLPRHTIVTTRRNHQWAITKKKREKYGAW